MSRWSPEGHDGFKVLASVYVNDRRKAFDQVRDRANSLATEALKGSENNQWYKITEENAVAALKAAARRRSPSHQSNKTHPGTRQSGKGFSCLR